MIKGLFFAVIFSLQLFILSSILFDSSALLSRDPYFWTKDVLFLKDNGYINYEAHGGSYPFGFTLYCGGSLLISPSFLISYSFMKFGSLPFLNIYLIVLYVILKRLLKNQWMIFICLVICLSNIYFIYRISMFISSAMAVLVILIGLLILITNINNSILGLVIFGSFMFNPAYTFFFILSLGIFYGIKFIKESNRRKEILKQLLRLSILAIFPLSLYILSLPLYYNSNFISVFLYFLRLLYPSGDLGRLLSLDLIPISEIFTISVFDLVMEWIYLSFFNIIPIIALLLKNNFNIGKKKDFNLFFKVSLTVTFVILIVFPFMHINVFLNTFFMRIIEGFNPFIIISIGLILSQLSTSLIKIGKKIQLKFARFKVVRLQKLTSRLSWKSISICVLLTISFLTYSYAWNNVVYIYLYDNSMIDCVFYINENYESNVVIGVQYINDNNTHSVYDLLFDYQLVYYTQNNNWTVDKFVNFTQTNSLDGFIIKLDLFELGFIDDFQNGSTFYKLAGGPTISEYQLYKELV